MNDFGRYGIWVSGRLWPTAAAEIAAAAQELEALGFGSVWIGGSPPDDLALPEAILAATGRIVVGTSIVNVWTSDASLLDASHQRIRGQFPGRFYLGLGSGHAPAAEAGGQAYVRPLSKLRAFAAELSTPREEHLFAALGPKTLAAAATDAAGALPYLVPPSHTRDARKILGPSPLLIPEQKIFLGTDESIAKAAARRVTAPYLALPNYTNNLRRYGLTDDDFAGGGSDRWLETLVAWGDGPTVRSRIDAHLKAGADHVAVHVLAASADPVLPRAEWRALASVLFS
jgi:probable F420-dependent oxidoreductase